MSFFNLSILLVSVFTASLAQIFLKKGALALKDLSLSWPGFTDLILSVFKNKWLFSGGVLFVISFFFYIFTLSKLELGFAYPVMVSLGMVLVLLGSQLFLGESLSWLQVLGIILILFSIYLLVPKT